MYEVEGMPIGKKQFKSLVSIERENIRFDMAHSFERMGSTAVKPSNGTTNSSAVQRDSESVQPLLL